MDVDNARPRPHCDAVPRQLNYFDFFFPPCNLGTFDSILLLKLKWGKCCFLCEFEAKGRPFAAKRK